MIAPAWASTAVLHIHPMAPWWSSIHQPPRPASCRTIGNVTFLPPPLAGYRLRHEPAGTVVEIKPRRASAIEIARCRDVSAARAVLANISADHARPILPEIGKAAA